MTRVIVAMSGGVDSSVAAALLVEKGYDVIGIMLRLWNEDGKESYNRCCTPDAMSAARRVAAKLSIPFYAMDVRQPFYENIVQFFLDGYQAGITPNPCLQCNRHIRFGVLLEQAIKLGGEYLATGHYARLRKDEDGKIELIKGLDQKKDQSYVLSILSQDQLSKALFPVGEFDKAEVREIARAHGLPTAEKSDSQDLCFLAGDDYRNFLKRNAPEAQVPGPILNQRGETIGHHDGIAFYTIGQRKGLKIQASQPHYVLDKDIENNHLIVGTGDQLGGKELTAIKANWVNGAAPTTPFHGEVKIRYQAKDKPAMIQPEGQSEFKVIFNESVMGITPGQAAVVYRGEICVGSGIIK